MTRARDLLIRGFSNNGKRVEAKLLSDTERGRIVEFVDTSTGETKAFIFEYPDGRTEIKQVRQPKQRSNNDARN